MTVKLNIFWSSHTQDRVKYRIVRAGAERGAGQTHYEDDASIKLKNSHMIELSADFYFEKLLHVIPNI